MFQLRVIENQELMLMLVVVMMAVERIKRKPGALRSGDDGHGDDGHGDDGYGDDGDGDFVDDRKALVMIILPMIPITVKRSRAIRVCGAL